MSVKAGASGQTFDPGVLPKIKELADREFTNIEIDGGITLENAKSIVDAGADILVAGSTVFKSADPKHTIAQLKSI